MPKQKEPSAAIDVTSNSARAKLRDLVHRIEEQHDERTNVDAEIAALYREVKNEGFDKRVVREVVRLRGKDQAKRREFEDLVDLYESQLK